MTADGERATRVELVLHQEGKRAMFSMHGPTWQGGPLRFELVPREHGFALRDDDESDPLDECFESWEIAVAAFVSLTGLHLGDELSPGGVGHLHADPHFGLIELDEAERVRRATFGLDRDL